MTAESAFSNLLPINLRQYLSEKFKEMQERGDNIISNKNNIPHFFAGITSPNEFAGPLIEAWAHIQLAKILDNYRPATARGQEFADATAVYNGKQILLNIKAKDREMQRRSRINLSSLNRYREYYSQPQPDPFYVLVCQYEWQVFEYELKIVIEGLKYTFDLLEVPLNNYKIEGAFEGSYRIFISPIPEEASTDYPIKNKAQPYDFLLRLEELKNNYDSNKAARNSRSRRA